MSGTPAAVGSVQMNAMTPQELAKRCGLVFQFPERYFLGGTLQEVAFWTLLPQTLYYGHARVLCHINNSFCLCRVMCSITQEQLPCMQDLCMCWPSQRCIA